MVRPARTDGMQEQTPPQDEPTVVLVGRPNVGKSCLFNQLIGARRALVFDRPGVTRDCMSGICQAIEEPLWLVDSGGVELESSCPIRNASRQHLERIIRQSMMCLFVVDAQVGLAHEDEVLLRWLRPLAPNMVLVINKTEGTRQHHSWTEFASLGIDPMFCVSAEHRLGLVPLVGHLQTVRSQWVQNTPPPPQAAGMNPHASELELERCASSLCASAAGATSMVRHGQRPLEEQETSAQENLLALAVIGRPNVGKSSLINCMLGKEQHLASPIAGTTMDACDSLLHHEDKRYVLVDTAGIRRPSQIKDRLEQLAIGRSFSAMDRAQVVLLVLDGTEQPTEQDMRLAMMAVDKGKGLLFVVNKWDLPDNTLWRSKYDEAIYHTMPFARFAPIVHVSAKFASGLHRLYALIEQVRSATELRIGTGELNRWMQTAITRHPPAIRGGKRPKLLYVTQPHVCPPTIVFKGNREQRLSLAYRRYLENTLRERYPLQGTPVWFKFRGHDESKTS